MTRTSLEAVRSADTVEVVTKALRQAGEPVSVSKLRDRLSGPYRLPADALTELLEQQVAAGQLFRFAPYMSKLPRYGAENHEQHACRVIEHVLAAGPLTLQALQKKITKQAADCSASRRKELLESLVRQGRVRRLPPVPGSRTTRYGVQAPDPVDYVQKLVKTFLENVRKQSKQLAEVGVEEAATREVARRLVLEGLAGGSSSELPVSPSAQATSPVPPPLDVSALQAPELGSPERESPERESPERAKLQTEATQSWRTMIREQLAELREDPRRGPLVPVKELRQALDFRLVDKRSFDETILRMAREGLVALYQHDYPASLSEQERDLLVRDGEGNYYNGISLKEGR